MFPGYRVSEEIYRGRVRVVYRGHRESDGAPVILKTLIHEFRGARALANLRREFEILRSLDIHGVARAVALETTGEFPALVLDDAGGIPLKRVIGDGIAISDFLRLSRRLADIVAEIHRRGIIHKDINPNNVLVQAGGGDVVLVDFGIASRLPFERHRLEHPNVLEGTIAYMSPEQTGRMNRDVDYRTDLYSLGVTLYEMLCGRLPFESPDPLEVIHCHIAMPPPTPREIAPRVPVPLSEIVLRLLAKAPEDRYQSAIGLRGDLDRCLAELELSGTIREVVAGGCDVTDRFIIPQRLYGRDAEVAELMGAFERACQGGVELVAVSGYSGIGKTSLIHEIHKTLARRRAYFISGKFDQLVRNVPYAAITQAFSGLVRQLLTESDESIARWRARILDALAGSGQVIVDVVPDVELLIGEQPPVAGLGATEAQNRFNLLFQKFLGVFAGPEHPLVIFLDDLQWADLATLGLLGGFMTNPDLSGLLLIGAYRDNEVGERDPLLRVLAEVRRSETRFDHIALGPLAPEDLNRFLADALRTDTRRSLPLAELVQMKTEGNPFFVTQFLRSLHSDGALSFDYEAACWTFDLDRIRSMEMTDNVVELMARKIRRLAAPTQRVLELAACIGGRFDLRTLATVNARPIGETAEQLSEALAEGLVVPLGGAFDLPPDQLEALEHPDHITYRFLHDRVQQAAYALIAEQKRPQLHLTVGRLILARADAAQREERIFELVDQLNLGAELIHDEEERLRVAELNSRAGRKAKASAAFSTALNYFTAASHLLGADPWRDLYDTAYPLQLEIAECLYLCGRFDEAEREFDELVRRAKNPLDEARAHILRVIQYENLSRYADAIEAAKRGLRLFGIELPETSAAKEAALEAEIAAIDGHLQKRRIEDLIDLPQLADPHAKMCMRLLMAAWAPAYIAADHGLIALIATKMVTLSLERGNTEESACGYAVHGITVGTGLGNYAVGHEFGRLALQVNEKFDDISSRAKVHELFACFINLWCRPIETCLPHARKAYESGLASGDLTYATYSSFVESWYGLLSSRDLRAFQDEYGPLARFFERIRMESFADAQQVILHWGLSLEGRTSEPGSLDDDTFTERRYARAYEGSSFFETFYFVTKLQLLYTFERYEEAYEFARKAEGVVHSLAGTIWPVLVSFYHALALLALGPERTLAKAEFDAKVDELAERLGVWATSCSENFRHLHLLVLAEIARRAGDVGQAVQRYEEALAAAVVTDRLGDQALANELYARFWRGRGQERIAAFFMCSARSAYAEWGAGGKVQQLTQRYPELILHPAVAPRSRGSVSLSTTQTRPEVFDLSTVMKAARAIAGEIELEKLLSTLMHILIENAGAQRGLLILEQGGESLIQAIGAVGAERAAVAQAVPLEEGRELSRAIVNYVKRTLTSVVLGDAEKDPTYAGDPYIAAARPKSILCTPIINQGELVGAVYLENNLASAAFTPERIQVVQMLSGHAAIAIKNAELFAEVASLRDRLQAENVYLQEEIKTQHGFEEIVGKSAALKRVLRQVEQVAPTDATVLIGGETGTGKELVARAIHNLSGRRERPLVTLNCGAISSGLVESELFGHEKGAFTGALARKIGRFELADGGTIFLDEIGDLPLELQVKLLRVLQEGEIQRVGGSRTLKVDVRVIAATHQPLEDSVTHGAFRSDLYYRLNVFPIHTPPLRERPEDIPLLVRNFVLGYGLKLGKRIENIPKRSMDALVAYTWPGNIRELRNVIERAVIISSGPSLELDDWIAGQQTSPDPEHPGTLEEMERSHIIQTLRRTGWRVSGPKGAALVLGLKPTTLEARMRKLGIRRPEKAEQTVPNIS